MITISSETVVGVEAIVGFLSVVELRNGNLVSSKTTCLDVITRRV
jgi:hypothetical protein